MTHDACFLEAARASSKLHEAKMALGKLLGRSGPSRSPNADAFGDAGPGDALVS